MKKRRKKIIMKKQQPETRMTASVLKQDAITYKRFKRKLVVE